MQFHQTVSSDAGSGGITEDPDRPYPQNRSACSRVRSEAASDGGMSGYFSFSVEISLGAVERGVRDGVRSSVLIPLRPRTFRCLLLAALPVLAARCACAMDMRFDVATDNNNGLDTAWFGTSQLPALNFPSVNGHNIEQGSNAHNAALTAAGKHAGDLFRHLLRRFASKNGVAAATESTNIQSWIKSLLRRCGYSAVTSC